MTDSALPDDELTALWKDVLVGVGSMQRRIESDLEAAGLSAPFVAVLRQLLLAEGHRLPMSVIARDLSMTPGGFTKLADRMARDGLIDRRSSESDRRVVHAQLTGAGLELAEDASRRYTDALRHHVGVTMSRADLAALAEIGVRLRNDPVPVADDADFLAQSREPAAPDRRERAR